MSATIKSMKTVIVAALTMVGLFGQMGSDAEIRNALTSSLISLRNADRDPKRQTDELTARMLAVPESMHQPGRLALTAFARELAGSLAGRDLIRADATQVAAGIVGALRSTGMVARTFQGGRSLINWRPPECLNM